MNYSNQVARECRPGRLWGDGCGCGDVGLYLRTNKIHFDLDRSLNEPTTQFACV